MSVNNHSEFPEAQDNSAEEQLIPDFHIRIAEIAKYYPNTIATFKQICHGLYEHRTMIGKLLDEKQDPFEPVICELQKNGVTMPIPQLVQTIIDSARRKSALLPQNPRARRLAREVNQIFAEESQRTHDRVNQLGIVCESDTLGVFPERRERKIPARKPTLDIYDATATVQRANEIVIAGLDIEIDDTFIHPKES